jgi:hypothetical protein
MISAMCFSQNSNVSAAHFHQKKTTQSRQSAVLCRKLATVAHLRRAVLRARLSRPIRRDVSIPSFSMPPERLCRVSCGGFEVPAISMASALRNFKSVNHTRFNKLLVWL